MLTLKLTFGVFILLFTVLIIQSECKFDLCGQPVEQQLISQGCFPGNRDNEDNIPLSSVNKRDTLSQRLPRSNNEVLTYNYINDCIESVTTVNGVKQPCKGRIIFHSEFYDGIGKNWSHEVKMNDYIDEDEFTVFDKHPSNIYTDRGSLVIKPRLLDERYGDEFTIAGLLDLRSRCTSTVEENCVKEAKGGQVLPPVISARITTKDFFSFQYGGVEVRAMLPHGDWVVPEIWLLPKYNNFGKRSAKIVLAQSLGNDDVTLNDIQLGNSRCFVRLQTGSISRNCSAIKNSGTWSDNYSTFHVVWLPDGITFGIDGTVVCNWNFTTDETFKNVGYAGNNPPLNEEYYLVLGLHVGGVSPYEFPDGIINRGNSKPWKNNGARRRISFYNDSKNWFKTWSDKTMFKVDYVKIWTV